MSDAEYSASQPAGDMESREPGSAAAVTHDEIFAAPKPKLPAALAVGVVTAIVLGAAWQLLVTSTQLQIGFAAIAVGFAIGAIMRRVAGPGQSHALVVSAMVLTLLTMLFAEFFIARAAVGQYFTSQGDTGALPLFGSPTEMVALAIASVQSDPLTLAFWALALYGAFRASRHVEPSEAPAAQPAWVEGTWADKDSQR